MAAERVFKLTEPIQFGSETIEELTLKRNARAMKDLGLKVFEDGSMIFEPYALAKVGVFMAGRPSPVLDLMDPADLFKLAELVLGFFAPGRRIGTEP